MRLAYFIADWVGSTFLLFWAGVSILVLVSGRRLVQYLIPWNSDNTRETAKLFLVRLAAALNFIAAIRLLLKAIR